MDTYPRLDNNHNSQENIINKQINSMQLRPKKRRAKGASRFLAAFFIPFFIILLSYAVQGVYPFGDRHILTIDLYHQYAPFLRELRDKLVSGDSLFYTWTGGMGFNFLGVITYYLASPFNFLLFFFKNSQISDAVLWITTLKIASASLSFYYCTYRKYNKHDMFHLAVGFAYALSAYSIAYSWNIMWLDTLIFLPLAALGLLQLVEGNSIWTYVLALTLILITNYYTGFFACIFLFFYYFVLHIEHREKYPLVKQRLSNWKSFVKFATASILSACLAAFTILPTVFSLIDTSATGDKFPDTVSFFEPFIDFISRFLILSPLSVRDGMPNLYLGVIVLILLPYFFINPRIKSKIKLTNGLLIVFLIISLNNNVLNFIWHGFHYPNQLPFRNSFVLIFLLCQIMITAYEEWEIKRNILIRKENISVDKFIRASELSSQNLQSALTETNIVRKAKTPWYLIFSIWLAVLLFLEKIDSELYAAEMILVSILLLFIYSMILNSSKHKTIDKKFVAFLLFFVMTLEITMHSIIGIHSIAKNEYYGEREGYKSGAYVESIHHRVEQIKADNINSRAALWPDKSVNDPMLYGFPGLTIFASTYPEEPVQFFENLGYDSNGINSYQNTGSNIVMDSLLGLEYKIRSLDRDEQVSFYDLIDADEYTKLYRNPYALPLLYLVPETAVNLGLQDSQSSFSNQKTLIQGLGGDPKILEIVNPELTLGLGNTIESISLNKYSVIKENNYDGERNFSFEFTADKAGNYTFAWQASGLKFSDVELEFLESSTETNLGPINQEIQNMESGPESRAVLSEIIDSKVQLSRKDNSLSDLGYLDPGQRVRITFKLSDKSSENGNITLEACRINQDLFEDFIFRLKSKSMNPLYISANHLKSEISVDKASHLLFTTTYNPAWSVKINGDKVDIKDFDKAMILIPIEPGLNSIDMVFIPKGFHLGLGISLVSLISCGVFIFAQNRKNR